MRPSRATAVAAAFVAVLLARPASALAQQDPERTRASLHVGLGAGSMPGSTPGGGLSATVEVALQRAKHRWTARHAVMSNLDAERMELREFGALYGRGFRRKHGHASVGTGLSWVRVCERPLWPSSGRACHSRPGIPLVAVAGLHLWALQIGIQGFANLNGTSVFHGVHLYAGVAWPP